MPIIILLICSILSLTGCGDFSSDHIDADDNGEGKSIRLIVRPDEFNGLIIRDENNNIASKWHDTGLTVSNFLDLNDQIAIGLTIKGLWYPFGSSGKKQECNPSTCGKVPDVRCNNLPSSTPVIEMSDANLGCYLKNGNGIYILLTKDGDPNVNPTVANSPGDGFYTAHLGDFKPNKNGLVKIDKVWSCNDQSSMIQCEEIKLKQLIGSKIYLKVYDSYYPDNTADSKDNGGNPYVGINIKTGVIYPNFVSDAITALVNNIDEVSDKIEKSLIISLIDVAMVIVMLYLAFTAFAFLIGMAKITQTEAVVRLLKVSIVLMFFSPDNVIANGFLHIYQELANFASNIIASSLPNTYVSSLEGNELEDNLNYLKMYDSIINQILSRQVHIKIISLLFTWSFWLIPFMYILIVMIIFIVLRSLLLYITAYVQIAFLIVIMPILVPTLLFNTTADIFQSWLKYMANSALLIVVATLGFGIVLEIMMENLGDLLSYSVSKTWWWFPDDYDSVSSVLNFSTYISTLIQALICYGFVEVAPKLADALSESQLSPSLNAFNALWRGVSNMVNEGMTKLKNFNNEYLIGRLIDQTYTTDGKYDRNKENQGILDKWRQKRKEISNFYDRNVGKKIERIKNAIDDQSIISFFDPYSDQAKNDYLSDLRSKNEFRHETYSDYREMIEKKKAEYITSVTMPDGTAQQLDGPGDTINYNGQDISKADIRAAVADNRPINIGQVTNSSPAVNQDKLRTLKEIEQDLVKRR